MKTVGVQITVKFHNLRHARFSGIFKLFFKTGYLYMDILEFTM